MSYYCIMSSCNISPLTCNSLFKRPAYLHSCSVKNRYCCSMHNSLRTYIHKGTGCHLSILRNSHRVKSLPIILRGVVGNQHTVCNDKTRSILVRREQSHRMSRIQNKSLQIGHLRKILHCKPILRPILESCTIAAVNNKFLRMLSYSVV